jgi:splicing factor, arginine/serine-rich 1
VELAKGSRTRGGRGEGNTREFRPPNTGYRVVVKGLPPSASWQDLKDFLRQAVRPAYTNVVRDRDGLMGVAEFESFDDMDRAIRKLDDTEFRNPYGHAYVRIYEDSSRGRGGGGRDRSRSRDRGRGRSPRRGRSTSRSRSRSPARGRSPPRRSPSPSRSRGRSPSRDGSPMEDRRRSPSPPAGDKYENAGDVGRDNEAELEERRDEEAAPVDE